MKKLLANDLLILMSRLILGTVFVVASLDKIFMPEAFATSVQAYQLVPFSLVNILALIIPWVELICGIVLICGVSVRASSLILMCLLLLFVLAIISAIVRQLKIDCGCFGAAYNSPVGWGRVLEDLGLLLLSVHLFFYPDSRYELETHLPHNE